MSDRYNRPWTQDKNTQMYAVKFLYKVYFIHKYAQN